MVDRSVEGAEGMLRATKPRRKGVVAISLVILVVHPVQTVRRWWNFYYNKTLISLSRTRNILHACCIMWFRLLCKHGFVCLFRNVRLLFGKLCLLFPSQSIAKEWKPVILCLNWERMSILRCLPPFDFHYEHDILKNFWRTAGDPLGICVFVAVMDSALGDFMPRTLAIYKEWLYTSW